MDINAKSPSHDLNAEYAILGLMVEDSEIIPKVMDTIDTPEIFYSSNNRMLFAEILELYQAEGIVNRTMLESHLGSKGLLAQLGGVAKEEGGKAYLLHLDGYNPKMLTWALSLVRFHYIQREYSYLSSTAEEMREDGATMTEVSIFIQQKMDKLMGYFTNREEEIDTTNIKTHQRLLNELDREMMEVRNGTLQGIHLGFRDIDKIMGLVLPGQVIVIGGGTSVGKTTFTVNLLHKFALQGKRSGLLSLEQNKRAYYDRLLCCFSGASVFRLLQRSPTEEDMKRIMDGIELMTKSAPIHIRECIGSGVAEVMSKMTRYKQLYNIDVGVIDLLNRINIPEKKNVPRTYELQRVMEGFCSLANRLNIPLIVVAQLNRETLKGNPKLKDFKDSSAIEQNADFILILNRKDYNTVTATDCNQLDVHIIKNRNGDTGSAGLYYNRESRQLFDLEIQKEGDFRKW